MAARVALRTSRFPVCGDGNTLGSEPAAATTGRGDAALTSMHVPHDASSAAVVRRALVRELERRGAPEPVVDDAVLVVSELVGNALRHGAPLPDGGVRVSWWVAGGAVHLEVCDGGPGLPGDAGEVRPGARLRDPDAGGLLVPLGDEGGRGLPIVDLLSARWGTTAPGPTGAVGVYAEIPLEDGPAARLSRGGRTVDAPAVGPWAASELGTATA
jgi:anti-sigma regulatory factor (Ser/Thr protein kinase)